MTSLAGKRETSRVHELPHSCSPLGSQHAAGFEKEVYYGLGNGRWILVRLCASRVSTMADVRERRINQYLSGILKRLEAGGFDPEEIQMAKAAFNKWQPILDKLQKENEEKP